jgi:hypothetical protein
VRDVFIEGRAVLRERELLTLREGEVLANAHHEAGSLLARAGLKNL